MGQRPDFHRDQSHLVFIGVAGNCRDIKANSVLLMEPVPTGVWTRQRIAHNWPVILLDLTVEPRSCLLVVVGVDKKEPLTLVV
jgi:hypothetical protein